LPGRDHFLYDTVSNAKYVPSHNRAHRFGLGIWRSLKCFYPSIWRFHHFSEIGRDGRVVLDHLPYWEEILNWVLFPARSAEVGNIRRGDNHGAVKEGQTSDALSRKRLFFSLPLTGAWTNVLRTECGSHRPGREFS
jgi:hypothetical protein